VFPQHRRTPDSPMRLSAKRKQAGGLSSSTYAGWFSNSMRNSIRQNSSAAAKTSAPCPPPAHVDLLRDVDNERQTVEAVRSNAYLSQQGRADGSRTKEAVVVMSNAEYSRGSCAYEKLLALLETAGQRDVVLMPHGSPSESLLALPRPGASPRGWTGSVAARGEEASFL